DLDHDASLPGPSTTKKATAKARPRSSGKASHNPRVLRTQSPQNTESSEHRVLRTQSPQVLRTQSPQVLRTQSPQVLRTQSPQVLRTQSPQNTESSGPQNTRVLRSSEHRVLRTQSPQGSQEPQIVPVTNQPTATKNHVPKASIPHKARGFLNSWRVGRP
ncbi:unnamed protein product, partial [Owenia fusiformis]